MENKEVISNIPVTPNFVPIKIEDDHYVLGDGNLSAAVIFPDGHGWGEYLPLGETQFKNGVDPQTCPEGGTLNCIEAVGNRKFNANYRSFQDDLSERYGSIMSGMNGNGGNPHVIAEAIRLYGCIPEIFLPFDQTITSIAKYFLPRPMTYALFRYGYAWIGKYLFGHQWLFTGGESLAKKQAAVKRGLQSSPVGVAGYAWSLHGDMKYYNDGPAIHWFVVYDYVEGDHWLAFDTYPPYVKKLDWNYDFAYAKGYALDRRLGGESTDLIVPKSAILPYIKYLINSFLGK